jgi:hypothetical protein
LVRHSGVRGLDDLEYLGPVVGDGEQLEFLGAARNGGKRKSRGADGRGRAAASACSWEDLKSLLPHGTDG